MSVLRPGRNVWRVERAARAAVLIDGAAFFEAVREACLRAHRSVLIVGWDIDSRTPLVGESGIAADGYPGSFAEFLSQLVRDRPELSVDLLLWDYSLLYAGEREMLPRLSLQWRMPERITLRLDNTVPFGCSQHQKLVIIDDALAFSGGLDITIRRWDTPAHQAHNHRRVDPSGVPYRPFHDVQMMVDGAAARALALLARQRWCRVEGGQPCIEPVGDPWPPSVSPDFHEVDIAIARTQPRYNGDDGAREVEELFADSIAKAERSIYIENQFLSSRLIARSLARQLRQRPRLEVVIVAPRSHDSWIERRTMRNGRIRFCRLVQKAGGGRMRLVYPAVAQDGHATDTMIHSKVMIIDDRFLRIGSANLNNRSMGVDTECDLAIEASTEAERATIRSIRDRLLGEHCGLSAEEVALALERMGSLVQAADTLSANGHCLRPIEDGAPDRHRLAELAERIADPVRPPRLGQLTRRLLARALRPSGPRLVIAALAVLALGLTMAWHFTDLSGIAAPEQLADLLSSIGNGPWTPLLVVTAFVLGGAVAFPVNILILATSFAFGPWWGALYSGLGALASALAMYGLGARFGKQPLDRLLGGRWQSALEGVRQRGVLAVVALRLVPVAPFTLVNLAAGASGIRLTDFVLGTVLGMAPGLGLLAIMGDRLAHLLSHPSAGELGLLALCLVAWVALAVSAQALLSRRGRRTS
jgi:phospholipase D1/2